MLDSMCVWGAGVAVDAGAVKKAWRRAPPTPNQTANPIVTSECGEGRRGVRVLMCGARESGGATGYLLITRKRVSKCELLEQRLRIHHNEHTAVA
jgi:hypothetical protein